MSSEEKIESKPAASVASAKDGAQTDTPSWMRFVALLTGVLAGLGGFLTVRGAGLSNDAIYRNTQAVLYQAKASDTWTEYQADSIKFHIIETQLDVDNGTMNAAARKKLEAERNDYRQRQPPLKQEALDKEATREDFRKGADNLLNEKSYLDIAGMAVQLGIALASVAALTRRKEAFIGGLLAGAAGAGITAYVLVHQYLVK